MAFAPVLSVRDLPPAARAAAVHTALREIGVPGEPALEYSAGAFVLEVGDTGHVLDEAGVAVLEALVLAVLNFRSAERAMAVAAPQAAVLAAASLREKARDAAEASVARLRAAGIDLGPVRLAA